MGELLLLFILVGLAVVVESPWFSFVVLIIACVIIFPGMYAMVTGAPFVPSNKRNREAMFRLANVTKGEVVVELGCGDGRIIREAAGRGARVAIGYEYSLPTWLLARILSWRVRNKVQIVFGNFWHKDLSGSDVVFCFLMKESMKEFERAVWPTLKKGARVVSNQFVMPGVVHEAVSEGVYLYLKK